jgi:hypothetical protein
MPIFEHPFIDTPSDDTVIWRYLNFVKFMSLLEKRCLFFTRPDKFEDPFEGSLIQDTPIRITTADGATGSVTDTHMRLQDVDETSRKIQAEHRRRMVLHTYINCWYARPHDSTAMWAIYANPDDGVAIRSTVGRLAQSISTSEREIYIGSVQYIDFLLEPGTEAWENSFTPFLHKRLGFEHENEVRAITTTHPDSPPEPGLSIQADLNVLIEGIVIAPQAAEWFSELVSIVTTKYEIGVAPVYSPLAVDPFWGDSAGLYP